MLDRKSKPREIAQHEYEEVWQSCSSKLGANAEASIEEAGYCCRAVLKHTITICQPQGQKTRKPNRRQMDDGFESDRDGRAKFVTGS